MRILKNTVQAVFMSLFILSSASVSAQIKMPQPSPGAKVSQTVGLTDITVNYSRPSMKGRKIFGELVPFDKKWRTGANASTKISFTDEVNIQGTKVPAGEYVMLTIPGRSEWTIILNKNLKISGDGGKDYNAADEVANFKVKPTTLSNPVESFTIGFTDLTMNGANIELAWENTSVKFPVSTDVDTRVMSEIKEKTSGVSATTYFQAARYYYDANKDIKQAVEWINKAVEMDPKFYIVHLQANILAKSGDKKKALEAANRSLKLAKEADNADYVALNEKLIAELNNKK